MFIIGNNQKQYIIDFESDVCWTTELNEATLFTNIFDVTKCINKWNLSDWEILHKELVQKENK